MLQAFAGHPQQVLSRQQFLDLTRVRSSVFSDRSLDVQGSPLRRKLEVDPHNPNFIKTIRSGGHIFAVTVIEDEDPLEAA